MPNAAIYICFANRAAGTRSDVLGPFAAVEQTFNSLEVTEQDGAYESLAFREHDRWLYKGREYESLLIVADPLNAAVSSIAIDADIAGING
jgi:hypothetical protein